MADWLAGSGFEWTVGLSPIASNRLTGVIVAVVVLVVTNELLKQFLLRKHESSVETGQENSVIARAAARECWQVQQAQHSQRARLIHRQLQEEQRQQKLVAAQRARKAYGVKVVLPGEVKNVGGAILEKDSREKLVHDHDAEAPSRQAKKEAAAQQAQEKKLAALEKQRQAYGLPRSQKLRDVASLPSSSNSMTLVDEQNQEYQKALEEDIAKQAPCTNVKAVRDCSISLTDPPPEPDENAQGVTNIRFRLPSGAHGTAMNINCYRLELCCFSARLIDRAQEYSEHQLQRCL